MTRPLVGIAGPATLIKPRHNRGSLLSAIQNSSIDHLVVGDHVSFHDGFGFDGLINAATLAALTDDVKIFVGVYLLALRHPVTVARQLSSLSAAAPGRLILGVGLGGEDRHELEICGVDPRTRGRRTNDSLAALRSLMTGKPFSYDCDYAASDLIVEFCHRGMAAALQFAGDAERSVARAKAVAEACDEEGLIVRSVGHSLVFVPPLIIGEAEFDDLIDRFGAAGTGRYRPSKPFGRRCHAPSRAWLRK